MAEAWQVLQPTVDAGVRIEEQSPGYVRYRADDGRRWEVRGTCDRRGNCLVGAVIQTPGGLVEIESLEHIERLKADLGVQRLISEMDVPVGPGFEGCCPLEVTELASL
jgi:hypothetical protein